jgi:nickel transport protein
MKSNPCFVSVASAAFAALLACAPLAQAHNVWLEPDADGAYTVQFGGHEGKLESFAADKLKSVHAYDARGRSIDVAVRPVAGGARVVPARKAALLAAHFDNGFFSRVGEGPMVEKPMTENPGATSGVHALKFHKTILEWGPVRPWRSSPRPAARPMRASPSNSRCCWTASPGPACACRWAKAARRWPPMPMAW